MRGQILIVDDNPIDLALSSALLGVKGFQVEVAVDAEQAQLLLQRMVPDLMVVDIALPGMDGLTLARRVKADARLEHVPVVALTAFAKRGDEQSAAAAGCDRYFTKPLDTKSFGEDIAATLESARARRRRALRTAG
ncbi:MAG TPA: response regulator [Steroidobacteraceae bacterium]|nr:response regulator [Steroidobacteraceae bacterium]